jgi:hypothetical protein
MQKICTAMMEGHKVRKPISKKQKVRKPDFYTWKTTRRRALFLDLFAI